MTVLEVPSSPIKEPVYTRWLVSQIGIGADLALAREIVLPLLAGTPASVRDRVTTGQPYGWTTGTTPSPDVLIGDQNDQGLAVLEFKSRNAATNWTSRGEYRRCHRGGYLGTDPLSVEVYEKVLHGTRAEFDPGHLDDDCLGTATTCGDAGVNWKPGKSGRHFPCLHQGDVYTTSRNYLPDGFHVGSLRDLSFVFVAPNQAAVDEWKTDLISIDEWSIVMLPDVLRNWDQRPRLVPGLDEVVDMTSRFLRES